MKTNSTKTNTNPIQVSISALHPFENHPYKVIDNEEMEILIQSVQAQGIMSPLIVRKLENTENKYEVISGHRRLRAAKKAGLKQYLLLFLMFLVTKRLSWG